MCKLDRDLQQYASGIAICNDMQVGLGFAALCKLDRDRDLQQYASRIDIPKT